MLHNSSRPIAQGIRRRVEEGWLQQIGLAICDCRWCEPRLRDVDHLTEETGEGPPDAD